MTNRASRAQSELALDCRGAADCRISIMKKAGCILEFTLQRNDELMRAFRSQVRSRRFVEIGSIVKDIVDMPASRFWVSEERAWIVVLALIACKPVLETMRPTKREMFSEIYRRFCELRPQYPDAKVFDIVCMVVNSPAPKFYMTPSTAQDIIEKIKNGHYNHLYPESF